MTKTCPKCGAENDEESIFCKKCGKTFNMIKNKDKKDNNEKNVVEKLNDNISILGLIIAFLVSGIFLFLGSLFYGLFLSKGIINFIIYVGLTIVTALFFGSLIMGICGCVDYKDAKSNSIALLLSILAICFGFGGMGFLATSGISNTLSSAFGSNNDISTFNGATTTTQPDNSLIVFILECIIFIIIAIIAIIGGCYLGVYLKEVFNE